MSPVLIMAPSPTDYRSLKRTKFTKTCFPSDKRIQRPYFQIMRIRLKALAPLAEDPGVVLSMNTDRYN